MNALENLNVLDLSSVLAGPSVATFFAELGATVVKIENALSGGDVTRTWKLDTENDESAISAYFASVNYGKKIVLADLSSEAGQSLMFAYLSGADILIHNFKTHDLAKFNLEPGKLKDQFPQLIHMQLTGFESEPDRLAYDLILQAESGFMSMNGDAQSGPVKMPVALIDVLAAHQMKEACLLALYNRALNNKGAFITCTLEASALAALTNQASNYLMAGHIARPIGSLHPNIAPYGEHFTCADGKSVVLAIGSDRQFAKLCHIIKNPELADDPRFINNPMRVKNRGVLAEIMAEFFTRYRADELLTKCHRNGVPAGEIKDMAAVCHNPVAQRMILKETIEGTETTRLSSVAFTFHDSFE